jgi:signal transduction histidine kinase
VDDAEWGVRSWADRRSGAGVERIRPGRSRLDLDALCEAAGLEPTGREPSWLVARTDGPEYRELTVVQLTAGDRSAGWVMTDRAATDYLARRDANFLRNVGDGLAMALASQRSQAALRERVKELSCLYELAQLARRDDVALDDLLATVATRLPAAWQYPDVATAVIELDGVRYGSEPSPAACTAAQEAALVVAGTPRGRVVIRYLEARAELDEGPFLAEERSLLEAVAAQVGIIVAGREAESEHERLQAQLRHADRLATVGQLAAGVAHELNEPIGAILGFAQLARAARAADDPDREDLDKIEAAALHARDIVRQLVLFAQRAPFGSEPIDLDRIIDQALVIVEPRVGRSGVVLDRHRSETPCEVVGDPVQLRQVIVNLVVNAVQSMPDGGRLGIRTRAMASEVIVEISDTGTGMPDSVREQAFLPFFTTREVDEGTGLGLAVVHGIVTGHGGSVDLRSRPGDGTNVVFRLPTDHQTVRR